MWINNIFTFWRQMAYHFTVIKDAKCYYDSDFRWPLEYAIFLSTSVDFIVYLGSLMLEQATWHCSSVYGNLGVYLYFILEDQQHRFWCVDVTGHGWLAPTNHHHIPHNKLCHHIRILHLCFVAFILSTSDYKSCFYRLEQCFYWTLTFLKSLGHVF